MRIQVFVSQIDDNAVGFTLDETGGNLSANLGPWDREELPGVAVITEADDPISEAVERDGFCVVDEPSGC